MSRRLHPPRLPVLKPEPGEEQPPQAPPDHYRKRIMDNDRLSISHTRVYDYWRPRVGAPTAYQLALVAFCCDQEYQQLKREAGA